MIDVHSHIPIRFERFGVRARAAERTPRRIAAARRAVLREAEAMPLFPELRRWRSVEDRLADFDIGAERYWRGLRTGQAQTWRRVRRTLRSLPALHRAGILMYWKQSKCPGRGGYLADLLHGILRRGEPGGWARLREHRQLALVGAGKLSRGVVFRKAV